MIEAFQQPSPETLRRQAALYRRLAGATRDAAVAERLIAWAVRYEAQAGEGPSRDARA